MDDWGQASEEKWARGFLFSQNSRVQLSCLYLHVWNILSQESIVYSYSIMIFILKFWLRHHCSLLSGTGLFLPRALGGFIPPYWKFLLYLFLWIPLASSQHCIYFTCKITLWRYFKNTISSISIPIFYTHFFLVSIYSIAFVL